MKKIHLREILSWLTGILYHFLGISWNADPDEKKIAEEILTYFENKKIFYAPFKYEHPNDCYNSVSEVRNGLNELMQNLY